MDRSAHGLAAIGMLECLALLVFAASPLLDGGGAAPNHNSASLELTNLSSHVPSDVVDGGLAMDDAPGEPQASLSICADINMGFICAP